MSRRITSDLINITNGLHHLNGYFSGKKYLYPYGCSRRVIPSSTAPHRYECKYVKQDFYEGHTTNMIKQTILARMTNGISSNYIASETKTFTVKWFDTVYFDGKQAPARPIHGYNDTPKLQCLPLDPKSCSPSEKKSPASDPSIWALTCKHSKSNPHSLKEIKRSPFDLNLCPSLVTTEPILDVLCPTRYIINSHVIYFIENNSSLVLSENGSHLPLSLKYSVVQDLPSPGPCPPFKRCPSRVDNRRGSSCPPSSECPQPTCPPLSERPKSRCPPFSEGPKSRCPPQNRCPAQGDNRGGRCPPKICASNTGGSCAPPPKSTKKTRSKKKRSSKRKSSKKFPPTCFDLQKARKVKKPKKRPPICPPRKKRVKKAPSCKRKVKCCVRKKKQVVKTTPKFKRAQCIPLIRGKVYRSRKCPGSKRKPTGCAALRAEPKIRCPPRSRHEKKRRDAPPCPPKVKMPPKKK